jgi:hypothetical protein
MARYRGIFYEPEDVGWEYGWYQTGQWLHGWHVDFDVAGWQYGKTWNPDTGWEVGSYWSAWEYGWYQSGGWAYGWHYDYSITSWGWVETSATSLQVHYEYVWFLEYGYEYTWRYVGFDDPWGGWHPVWMYGSYFNPGEVGWGVGWTWNPTTGWEDHGYYQTGQEYGWYQWVFEGGPTIWGWFWETSWSLGYVATSAWYIGQFWEHGETGWELGWYLTGDSWTKGWHQDADGWTYAWTWNQETGWSLGWNYSGWEFGWYQATYFGSWGWGAWWAYGWHLDVSGWNYGWIQVWT